jgi:hypothetical protein
MKSNKFILKINLMFKTKSPAYKMMYEYFSINYILSNYELRII